MNRFSLIVPFVLMATSLLDIGNRPSMITAVDGQLVNFNLMSCADFTRHMSSTVPSRIGLLRRRRRRNAIVADNPLWMALDKRILVHQNEMNFKRMNENPTKNRRQILMGLLGGHFRDLLFSVLNFGDHNVARCKAQDPLSACQSIDNVLEQTFPGWFFDYQVTNNLNHIASQLTESPFHALFEAGFKAYKCFCQC